MTYANRGMGFEQLIDYTNAMYERNGQAVINKRPTPVKILGILSGGRISGFLQKPSTVDYDGTYQGRSIVFEAKSTKELNRFPLKNIENHQYEYLEKSHKHGAISFILISFEKHRTIYLMPFITLKHYWEGRVKGGRGTQSISLETLDVNGYLIDQGKVPVDYLKVVDQVWKLAA
ncbi:Holliday junction resolvase RecU [Chengkuizengella sp. SCS-71B]|uniref:Holliday junction resolvase RecU n=1 Tax=Chengkuizengella sp. SCS-71B TaxID=3115290 RepID=UPI0032C23E97